MISRRVKFTQTSCRNLPLPPPNNKSNEIQYTDTELKGFKLAVSKSGTRTFYYFYTLNGEKSAIRIGCYPDLSVLEARRIARDYAAQVAQFQDPKNERTRQRDMLTLDKFVKDLYLPFSKLHNRSYKADESKARIYLLPALGKKRLCDITQYDVQTYLAHDLKQLTPATMNRHRSLISSIFKSAIAWKHTTTNPCTAIKKLIENPPPVRYLSDEEVARVLFALDADANQIASVALALLLFTGLRLGEVLSARMEHFDLNQRQLYLPHTKAGSSRYVPLNDAAFDLLAYQKELGIDSPWIFPGKDTLKHLTNPRKAWVRALVKANVEFVRIHDIRHSYASACVRSGTSLFIVQKLLGHASPATSQRYAHLEQGTLRQASATAVQGFLKEVA